MEDKTDTAGVVVRPPIALVLAILVGIGLGQLVPMPFVPAGLPANWIGVAVILLGLGLAAWAIVTMSRAGSSVPTNQPTTAIVESGPYGFGRNPIYLGMFIILAGIAIGTDNFWLLVTLAAFALVVRYGVVAREEAYLERKFGDPYRDYRSRVRRWL